MTTRFTKQQIIAIGGHIDTSPDGAERVYLSNVAKYLDIDVTRGKSGGILSATMEGKRITRQKAIMLLNGIIYWQNGFICTNLLPEYLELINKNIAAEIKDCG